MRFKTMLRYGLLAAATAAISVPASSFGIGLQPTTVEMTMEPGQRQRQVVTLGNVHQEKTISLTLGLADWTLDEQGKIKLAPPGEREESASEWVRFSPAFITLEPGEKEQIVVDMAAPIRTDREGDFRFALIASTILPESRSGQSGVWKKYQIASLFYLTMGDAASTPEITASTLTLGEDGSQSVNLTFENEGNAHARLRGEVEITGDNGDAISMPINNLVVLHEGKREYGMPLNGDLPSNPKIKVKLENTYAPQTESGLIVMDTYSSPLVLKQAAIEPTEIPAETIIDEATSLE